MYIIETYISALYIFRLQLNTITTESGPIVSTFGWRAGATGSPIQKLRSLNMHGKRGNRPDTEVSGSILGHGAAEQRPWQVVHADVS